jgi:deoxyribodipyrimidine photo-lyase
MKSIFIFRRDLRLEDNTGLNEALKQGEVLPVFFLNPDQINDNEYKGDHALQFMRGCLLELNNALEAKGIT